MAVNPGRAVNKELFDLLAANTRTGVSFLVAAAVRLSLWLPVWGIFARVAASRQLREEERDGL